MARGRGTPRRPDRARASRSRPRCSCRSRCCAATAAATARSPSRPPGSTRRTSTPDAGARARDARRRARLLRGAVHAGRGARGALPAGRPSGSPRTATRRRSTTSRRSPSACSTRPACSPTPTRARCRRTSCTRLRAVSPSQGMMIETLAARLGEPGGPHYGAPDKTPERRLATLHAAGRARVPFTTGILVGIGETRAERIDALVAIAERAPRARPRAGSDRAELPAQARHRDAPRRPRARPTSSCGRSRRPALILPDDVHLQAPPNLSDDLAPLLAAGIDDWGGVSPRHDRPREPRTAVARARAAARRDRGRGLRARAAPHGVSRVRRSDPTSGCTPTCARRCSSPPTWKAWRATPSWSPGRDDIEPPDAASAADLPARAGGAVGEVLDGVLAGEEVGVDEIVTLLGARGPEVARVAEVADDLRRDDRRRRSHVRPQPQHQLHERVHVQVPVLRVLEGPALAQPARRAVPRRDGGDAAPRRRGRRVRRDRGVPAGRHPPRLRRRLLRRRRARGEGRSRPQIHVHGFTALEVTEGARRLDMPLRDYLLRLKDAGPRDAARHRGRDPRRRGAGGHLPRQGQHRGMAGSAPHRALGRPAVERHDHARHGRAAGARRAPPRAHARPAEGDRRLHRVRAAAVRAHGDADLHPGQGAARPDVPRGRAHARGRSHRVPRHDPQRAGVVGEVRRRAARARSCRPAPTTSAAR